MATFGYGPKTFVQGLAKAACYMSKYIAKHDATLKKYLPGTVYACLSSIATCLTLICEQKNKSAS